MLLNSEIHLAVVIHQPAMMFFPQSECLERAVDVFYVCTDMDLNTQTLELYSNNLM